MSGFKLDRDQRQRAEELLDEIMNDTSAAEAAVFELIYRRDAPPPGEVQVDAAREMPSMYVCPAGCGCEWRDNLNGTMSLYDEHQKSCGVCETLPLHKLIPAPSAPGNIQHHLYVAQRHDGMWLVCVGSQYDTKPEAQAACKSWIRHYAAIASHQAGVKGGA